MEGQTQCMMIKVLAILISYSPTQCLNQYPTYGSQYMMMSHLKGYDTHEDIIHVGNLRIHVPRT
jgi:hypothetical protein